MTERVDLCFTFYRIRKVIAFRQFAKIFKKLTFKVLIFQSDAKQWWHTRWEKRPNFSQVSGFSQAEHCIACLRFFLSTFPPFLLFKSPARSKSVGTIEYLLTVQYKIMENSLSYGLQRNTLWCWKAIIIYKGNLKTQSWGLTFLRCFLKWHFGNPKKSHWGLTFWVAF